MKEEEINAFLEDLSFNSKFEFLEEGKINKDLIKAAEKKGIQLPDKDLTVFKCIYAFTGKVNKNGCLLPKEEVEKSLPTLIGKAIDFDHFRKRVVGHWIDAELKGDEIIAIGIFFKGNFSEDYEIIKELFDKNNLSISFEAWGKRNYKEDGTYELSDISWAGGALLLKTQPAFSGAGVLEMAKNRILEFASIMTKPDIFIHEKIDKGMSHLKEQQIKELHNLLMFLVDELNKEKDETKKLGLLVENEDKFYNILYPPHKANLEESRYHIYDTHTFCIYDYLLIHFQHQSRNYHDLILILNLKLFF